MDPMTVVIWIIMGAIGGFLHWIIPTKGDKPDDWVELARRIAAGAIAVPAVMATGISAFPQLAMFASYGVVGEVLLGYFSVDIWKMFRDALAEAQEVENTVAPNDNSSSSTTSNTNTAPAANTESKKDNANEESS